jgi:hypothetical protein
MMSSAHIIKSFLGYAWVTLAIMVSIIGFKDMEKFEQLLVPKTGFQVSENWKGGKVDYIKDHGNYQTIVHQPVFAGLISESKNGFMQIDWTGSDNLHHDIYEKFDYDHDRRMDFSIQLNTLNNTASLKPFSNQDISIADQEVLVYGKSRTIRVYIKK